MQIDDKAVAAYKAGYEAYMARFLAGGVFDKDEATRAGLEAVVALSTPAPASTGEDKPIAWTGSGSLMALADGREGYIWPCPAGAHPIPLYDHPEQPAVAIKPLMEAARHLLEVGEFCRTDDTESALRQLRAAIEQLETELVAPASPAGWVMVPEAEFNALYKEGERLARLNDYEIRLDYMIAKHKFDFVIAGNAAEERPAAPSQPKGGE
jgi:hypothetical protein